MSFLAKSDRNYTLILFASYQSLEFCARNHTRKVSDRNQTVISSV